VTAHPIGPDDEPTTDDLDVADQVAYEDTGRPWGAWMPRQRRAS
jgi:hypothetical protein